MLGVAAGVTTGATGPAATAATALGAGPAGPGATLTVTAREAPLATMVVTRDPGELFLLRHGAGDDAIAFVERIDPVTLEPMARSADLAGGPMFPAAGWDRDVYLCSFSTVSRLQVG